MSQKKSPPPKKKGRPPVDLNKKVRAVLKHTSPMLSGAGCPVLHFEQSTSIGAIALKYVRDHVTRNGTYVAVYDNHLNHLQRMVLAETIQSFEQFLKDLAAVCIDHLSPYVSDDRFDKFTATSLAAYVTGNTVGKALCESNTWINNDQINTRFSALLKYPFGDAWEYLFPQRNQQPRHEIDRAATLAILWQIRNSLAHNVGVLTHSDSMKFRLLIGEKVACDCRLTPLPDDLKYVKRFLIETAEHTNERVATRLTELLNGFYNADVGLFDAQVIANDLSKRFNQPLTIGGCKGIL